MAFPELGGESGKTSLGSDMDTVHDAVVKTRSRRGGRQKQCEAVMISETENTYLVCTCEDPQHSVILLSRAVSAKRERANSHV